MAKFKFIAKADGCTVRFSLHDTWQEALKVRFAFMKEEFFEEWTEAMKVRAELLAADGFSSNPADHNDEETTRLIVEFFERGWVGSLWEIYTEELDEGDFMCPKCGQTKQITILCEPAWATYDKEENQWEDHGGHEYSSDSAAECPECDHKGEWRDFEIPA